MSILLKISLRLFLLWGIDLALSALGLALYSSITAEAEFITAFLAFVLLAVCTKLW